MSDSAILTTKAANQSINKLVQTSETSSRCHVSDTTQTTVSESFEAETTRNAVSRRTSQTRHESTQRHTAPTTLTYSKKTSTSAITSSNDQTSTPYMVTSSSSQTSTLTSITQTSTLARTTSKDMTTMSTTTTPLTTRTTDQSTMTNSPTSNLPQLCSTTSLDYCDCAADGIWTVIQKRFDGSVDFYRNWTEYKEGFGDENGEFWLGNEALHQMTSSANYTLKIYVTNWENITKYAIYNIFQIADEADNYRLTIGGYCGDAEDSMIHHHNGQKFSTKDSDNDEAAMNCAEKRNGAWWFGNCGNANLNGRYYYDSSKLRVDGINWLDWYLIDRNSGHSLKETTMLIMAVP